MSTDPSSQRRWRKNLYSNVGYKDNYTDVDTFLAQLRRNINQKPVSFQQAFLGAGRVTEQLCIVVIFLALYLYLIDGLLPPDVIFLTTSFLTGLCYLFFLNRTSAGSSTILLTHTKTVAIFFILGSILSPVLKTLTDTISTDTINATTFFMMLVHLASFDYKVPAAVVSNALSTNAAIFGSLCLASRLPTSFHAFILLTISVECFVLYPAFSHTSCKELTLCGIIFIFLATLSFLMTVSLQMSAFFVIIVLFLNVLCPILFVRWQRYKNNIYGPWDEAVINDKEN